MRKVSLNFFFIRSYLISYLYTEQGASVIIF